MSIQNTDLKYKEHGFIFNISTINSSFAQIERTQSFGALNRIAERRNIDFVPSENKFAEQAKSEHLLHLHNTYFAGISCCRKRPINWIK